MRALRVIEFKSAPSLEDVETPEPGPGEVRIAVAACGLNFADLLMIKGEYQATPPLPFTLGMEVAGRVDALGDGVTGLSVGDRVAYFGGHGGLAEFCTAPAEGCVALPDAMGFEDAAAFQIAYGTSHMALTYRAHLKQGETLLVLGAAGGVGLTAVEIGAALGAKVIAVARGDAKCAVALEAGADAAVDAEDPDLLETLRKMGGADVIYDPVGGELAQIGLRATKRGARFLVIGFASGQVPDAKLNHLLVKNIAVHGFYWGGYLEFDPTPLRASMAELFELYGAGTLKLHIGLTARLEEAPAALEKLRKRETTGKVVITI
ncbi:MAG: NADPH:quinone oxidoreductase family protein [Pseudomonadota bacterium]